MPITRSPVGSEIHPYTLSNEDIHWIGRLVRATAELEDIANEHFCRVARIPMGAAILILGRMSSSSRIALAKQFAQAHGADAVAAHNECFETEVFRDIIKCRNTVAHGVLLGKADGGEIAFETIQDNLLEGQSIVVSVNCYDTAALRTAALLAEQLIPRLEERLDVRASREKRRSRSLGPHSKAQGSQKSK